MAIYDNEWIVRYVDGELSPEETRQFETAMHADAGLAAGVARYREGKTVLGQRLPEDPTRDALTQRTARLNERYFMERTATRRLPTLRLITTIAAAACIIGVIIITWPADYTRHLDQIGQTTMIGMTERGAQTDTLLQKASVFFNQKQFDKALPILNEAVAANGSSQLPLFYRGIAAWHTGEVQLARMSFQQVYDHQSVLKDRAAFYMALTYAGEKDNIKANEWLQKIPATSPEYLKVNELQNLMK